MPKKPLQQIREVYRIRAVEQSNAEWSPRQLLKLQDCEFYEKPTWVRKRKAAAAVKRNQKQVSRESRKFTRLY